MKNPRTRDATQPLYYGDVPVEELPEDTWMWVSAVFSSHQNPKLVGLIVYAGPTMAAVVRTPSNGEELSSWDTSNSNAYTDPDFANENVVAIWAPIFSAMGGQVNFKWAAGPSGCIRGNRGDYSGEWDGIAAEPYIATFPATEFARKNVPYDIMDYVFIGPLVLDNQYYEEQTINWNGDPMTIGRQTNIPGMTMWIDGLVIEKGSGILIPPTPPANGGPI